MMEYAFIPPKQDSFARLAAKHEQSAAQCVKLTYSLTGPASLVKYFNTRPAVLTLDRVSAKVTYFRPP